jgi:hypothetical protein
MNLFDLEVANENCLSLFDAAVEDYVVVVVVVDGLESILI